ncbi:MAG: ABC transporter permease, partial [Cytophagaceae bacterium]|nr:ABC transporter permease [Gemmatimonadaceae bacterium]
ESVLLAVTAAALGVWVLWILLRVFGSRIPDLQVALHWPVLGFAFGFAILVGVVFGISPSLHATRIGVSDVLKDSGTALSTRSRLQSGLVVAQIALAQPLLLMLGTLIMDMRSELARRPAPLSGDRIVELRFRGSPRGGEASREDALRQLAERLGSLPGVVGAVPQQDFAMNADVAVHPSDRLGDRGQQERLRIRLQPAPSGYFELLEIPLVRGRGFTQADERDASSLVIGREFARELWGSADPIGRRFVPVDSRGGRGLVVVGVVDDQLAGLGTRERRVFAPMVRTTTQLLVRTEGPADALTATLRAFVASTAPGVSLTSVRTVAAVAASERSTLSRVVAGASTTGLIALLIGAIGLYAVVAFAVGQRTREIGIRTALGADRGQVVRMFVLRGLRLAALGLGIGLGLSIVALRVGAAVRGETLPPGTSLLGAVIMCLVIGVALVATWLPARRAAAVDPLSSLRTE